MWHPAEPPLEQRSQQKHSTCQLVFSTDFIEHESLALILRVAQTSVYDRKNTVVCRLARVSAPPFRASSDTWRDRRWRKNWFESSVEFVISDPGQLPYKTTRVWNWCVWMLVIAATLTGKPASCGHGSLFSRVFGSHEWKQTGSFCLLPDTWGCWLKIVLRCRRHAWFAQMSEWVQL